MADTTLQADILQAQDAVARQGDLVRSLKRARADADVVTAAVAELAEKKSALDVKQHEFEQRTRRRPS